MSTETIIAIWILPRRSSRLYKGKLIKMETKMVKWTECSLQKLECLLAPKTKQSYLFLAPLQWPWQGCWNLRRVCNAVRPSCVPPPPYRHYRHCPSPDHSPLFASIRWPGQAGLTSAGSVAAGSDGCLLGRIHFPCGYGVCAFVLLRCFSCSHTILPKEHSLGVIFFSSLSCMHLTVIIVVYG